MGKVKHYDFAAEQERQNKQIAREIRAAEQRSFEQRVQNELLALRAEVNKLHRDMFIATQTLERLIDEKAN